MHAPLLTLLSLAGLASAGLQELWWNITHVEGVNPDGLYERRAVGVNGTWPPPPIVVNTTDMLIVHAYNSLDDVVTLHHHGMFFNSSAWMDGAMGVSQCGIPPGHTFTYIVPINETDQSGTYWFHAHSKGQYTNGLRGPMTLIDAQEDPYAGRYDEEFTIVLGDWYHQQQSVLLKEFINIANPGGAEPVPDAGLIYFAQYDQYLPPLAGTSPTGSTSAVGFNENATLPFVAGKTYKLRIVNTAAFAGIFFWIDGHTMRIIEADGTSTEEYETDMINLSVAQRYSILVDARNDTTPSNFAIHCAMDTDMFDTVPDTLNPNMTAQITYDTSAPLTDYGYDAIQELKVLNDTLLTPSQVQEQLPPSSLTLDVIAAFDTMDDGTNHASFNELTYNPPLVPAVLSELTLGSNATVAQAYGPLSFVVDHLAVFDLIVKNSDTGKHPFHLHGHKFQIIGTASDYTSDDPSLNPPIREGQANPIRRDTVLIQAGHSVTLRVVADNPGVWFFHCHIEWHLEVGLALQIIEAPLEAQRRAQSGDFPAPPQELYDHCTLDGLPNSGNAAGFASTTDLTGLYTGPYIQRNGWHPKGIGAMFGCVFTATLGMATVCWYSFGGDLTEEEMEQEAREQQEAKDRRGKFFGLVGRKAAA